MNDLKQIREALEAVLCDPEGNPCIAGSQGDLDVISKALDDLRAIENAQKEVRIEDDRVLVAGKWFYAKEDVVKKSDKSDTSVERGQEMKRRQLIDEKALDRVCDKHGAKVHYREIIELYEASKQQLTDREKTVALARGGSKAMLGLMAVIDHQPVDCRLIDALENEIRDNSRYFGRENTLDAVIEIIRNIPKRESQPVKMSDNEGGSLVYGAINDGEKISRIGHAECKKVFRVIRRALLTTKRESGWQPIATAPKDGTEILLFSQPAPALPPEYAVAYWDDEDEEWYWNKPKRFICPTHWKPLTNPTDIEAQEGK